MSTIAEIEIAIERLPTPQVDELAVWLEAHRARRAASLTVEDLAKAGAGRRSSGRDDGGRDGPHSW